VESRNKLLYINTEMSPKQIAYRWGSILSQMPLHQIRVGSLRDGEKYQVETGYKILAKSGFYTAYAPNLTADIMTILSKKAKLQTNMDMIILDYVGRMEKSDPRLQEWQVLEQIIKTQKLLAQTLDVASMVLVQLNEDGSLQGAKRMKNECDLMLKLLPTDEDTADEMRRIYKRDFEPFNYRLYIDKARDSQAGLAIPLVFDKDRQTIREAIIRDGK
jgi:replicative DNA helicase